MTRLATPDSGDGRVATPGSSGARASTEHLAHCIRRANLGALRDAAVDEAAGYLAWYAQNALLAMTTDGHMRVAREDGLQLLSAYVESGFIKLNELGVSYLTKPIIGPALERDPSRIAEITNLKHFVATAKRFKIPVELPPEAEAALAMQAAMTSQMSVAAPSPSPSIGSSNSSAALQSVDPLAQADASTSARKTQRRRAP